MAGTDNKKEKLIDASEVIKHNTPESCWVTIHGQVYDVTDFLSQHPGGPKVILGLAGKDATSEFDPIHPAGTLNELPPSAHKGRLNPATSLSAPAMPPPNVGQGTAPNNKSREQKPYTLPPLSHQLNLDDFALSARHTLSPKALAYYTSAADDLITHRLNSSIFSRILLRPRVLTDIRKVSTETVLLPGHAPSSLPLFIAPAALAKLAHPSGEQGICTAAGNQRIIQCISNNASQTPEEVVANLITDPANPQRLWWQLYVQADRAKSERMIDRIHKTGKFTAIVLTVDASWPGKREADERLKNTLAAVADNSTTFSASSGHGGGKTLATEGGIGKSLFAGQDMGLVWSDLAWLRSRTKLPIIIKGLQTYEDCVLAAENPHVAGLYLSNHGGRAMDTAPPAILALLELRRYAPQVFGKKPIFVDGGIRRGTDVLKCLCLGATAVGIGRAALFGLSAYGPAGVERTIQILREEIEGGMKLLGVHTVDELGSRHVNTADVDGLVYKKLDEVKKIKIRAKL